MNVIALAFVSEGLCMLGHLVYMFACMHIRVYNKFCDI